MLHLLIAILGIVLTIFFVVGIHEFGHFIVARMCGVKVLRFSIGFGKTLLRWQDKKGTEYVFAAIPLGGYVKMLDESEGDVPKNELTRAYNRQSILKKCAIVGAGPFFNLLFAFLIYWLIFMIGFTSEIPVIGKISPDSIAAHAGMQPQQEIIKIANNPTPGWMSVIINLLDYAGETGTLNVTTKPLDTQQTKVYSLELQNWHLSNLKPDPLMSLGITPYVPEAPTVVGAFSMDSVAKSQLKLGDKIVAVDNKPITDWDKLAELVYQNPEKTLNFKIEREGKIITIPITIGYQRDLLFKKYGVLGVGPKFDWPEKLLRHNQYGPLAAFSHAWIDTRDFIKLNAIVFGKLVTGKVSTQSLGGPITIFESAGTALNSGIIPFLSFLAFLSISIGLINVLPIPGLDGGHLFMQVIEFIIRRPIPMKLQILVYRLGLILLLFIIAQALINDILRL